MPEPSMIVSITRWIRYDHSLWQLYCVTSHSPLTDMAASLTCRRNCTRTCAGSSNNSWVLYVIRLLIGLHTTMCLPSLYQLTEKRNTLDCVVNTCFHSAGYPMPYQLPAINLKRVALVSIRELKTCPDFDRDSALYWMLYRVQYLCILFASKLPVPWCSVPK